MALPRPFEHASASGRLSVRMTMCLLKAPASRRMCRKPSTRKSASSDKMSGPEHFDATTVFHSLDLQNCSFTSQNSGFLSMMKLA